mmetsp:Transcript_19414/g.62222  ORF Transcript_19414/g.62222 Transcript_19414/m.62222 type:complete len:243 (-) Transcript_19414:623-1351(-)
MRSLASSSCFCIFIAAALSPAAAASPKLLARCGKSAQACPPPGACPFCHSAGSTPAVESTDRRCSISRSSRSTSSRFTSRVSTTCACCITRLARSANLSVEMLSSTYCSDGERVAMMHVRELPPSASIRMRVSLESRNGMCVASGSVKAVMQRPRTCRLVLMLVISEMWPFSRVSFSPHFSEPARSTKLNLERITRPDSTLRRSTIIWKIEWLRLLTSFILVWRQARCSSPCSSKARQSCTE